MKLDRSKNEREPKIPFWLMFSCALCVSLLMYWGLYELLDDVSARVDGVLVLLHH